MQSVGDYKDEPYSSVPRRNSNMRESSIKMVDEVQEATNEFNMRSKRGSGATFGNGRSRNKDVLVGPITTHGVAVGNSNELSATLDEPTDPTGLVQPTMDGTKDQLVLVKPA